MKCFALTLMLLLALPAAAQDFKPLQTREPAVINGQGGTSVEVEGFTIWDSGDPPRRYQILGYVEDTRLSSGPIGKMRQKSLQKHVAAVAREHGGDAAILTSAEESVRSYSSGGGATINGNTATSTGWSRPIMERTSRYAIVKYLPDQP